MIFYIKLVPFSIIFYGLVYALPLASSCCDSDAKSSTLQFQVWCLTLFQRRPVKARWRGCLGILDNSKDMIYLIRWDQQMPKLRHANTMPTHPFTMCNTGGFPPNLLILLSKMPRQPCHRALTGRRWNRVKHHT